MENKEKNSNLNIFYNIFTIKNLTPILLGGGLIFSFLYFFGYSFLKKYFSEIGGAMIPISDLPSLEIAILGFFPFIFFIILYLLIYFLLSRVLFLLCGFFVINLKLKISNNKKIIIKFFLLIIFSLLSYFLIINLFSSYVIKNDLPYNFFVTFNKKIPIVEVIYTTPLINRQKIEQLVDNNVNCEELTIGEIIPGKMRFLKEDNYLKDASNNI